MANKTGTALAVLLLALSGGAAYAQDATGFPLDYTVEAGDITLDDAETPIDDIKTIHNGREFAVNVVLVWNELEDSVTSSNEIKWQMFIDGTLADSGTENLDNSRSLPNELAAGHGAVSDSGTHTISVKITLDDTETSSEKEYQSFNKGASFVPLVIVLIFAITTHMVELSLGMGIFVGACMVTGTVIDGFKTTLDTYILEALADVDHGYVYLFALFMSGMVGLIEKSGGLLGITVALTRFVKSSRSAQVCGFFSGLIIFFDDYANTLVVGSSMLPLMDAFNVSREKLAFIVDATAAPIASIVPISSWVGFEVGLIQAELDTILANDPDPEIATTGFGIFLQTIKYRYYAIFMLFLMAMLIVSERDMGPMLIAERKVKAYGRTDGGPGAALALSGEKLMSSNKPSDDTPCRWWNMAVPVVMLIFYIFYLLVWTGIDDSGNQSFLDIMQKSDSYSALLWGTMAGALTAYAFYIFQDKKDGRIIWFNIKGWVRRWIPKRCHRGRLAENEAKSAAKPLMSVAEAMHSFLQGMEHIFGALVVLTLAWASGHIMVAVGLDRLFGELIVESDLDYRMLPTISFVCSLFVALATGTSWGTMAIMFPLLLGPTYVASDGDPQIFYATTAGILAGSVAGDHASPISDTTVLSSLATDCQLLAHVRTQAPYVLVVSLWSILVGTIPIGLYSYPNGVAIFLGFVFMVFHTVFTSAKVINKTGRCDIFTELYLYCAKNEDLIGLKVDVARAFEAGGSIISTAANDEKGGDEIGGIKGTFGASTVRQQGDEAEPFHDEMEMVAEEPEGKSLETPLAALSNDGEKTEVNADDGQDYQKWTSQ